MIDLSVTKDPDWIKKREEMWVPISKMLSEDLRKNELDKVHHYFMTGTLRPGEAMSDGAKFSWFPIQAPDAWDYLFQYVIKDPKEFQHRFYFSFEDISHRALNPDEELAMWDYFAGEKFSPVVTSRVPVGEAKEFVSLEIDKRNVNSKFGLFFKNWAGGFVVSNEPKHIHRIHYWLDMLETVANEVFVEKGSDGDPSSKLGFSISLAFQRVCRPEYATQAPLSEESISIRKQFFAELRDKLDNLEMPSEMKTIWESTKLKGIVE